MPHVENNRGFSPAPLLEAFDGFKGTILDLNSGKEFGADRLRRASQVFQRQMVAQGLSARDGVVMALSNGPLFPVILAATLEAGASPIPVHYETPVAELTRTANQWGARFIATELPLSADATNALSLTTLADDDLGPVSWARVAGDGVVPWACGAYATPLHPTSGTTSEPKMAVRPGPCAVAEAAHYIETLDVSETDVILCVTPMSHAYAYGMCLMVTLLSSARLITIRSFNPKLVRRALSELNVSILPVVPAMLDLLVLGRSGDLITAPRFILSAGAPLDKRTADRYVDCYGIRVRPLYGTTETGGISIAESYEEFDGNVGPPMSGVELRLRIREEENYGQGAGILQVRSSSMMSGYLERGIINSGPIVDGWFETGDIARIDERGCVHLLGRESEAISVFGMKVIPGEVEAAISLFPGVAEVKVYAEAHRSGSEIVAAAIVAREKIDEDEIRMHCQRQLVKYKCPSVIRFLNSLPRTPSGKVIVRQLRKSSAN